MQNYHELLEYILGNGTERGDRTGTGTIGVFGPQLRFDLNKGFPLITTKKVNIDAIITELLFFISGSTDNNWLQERNCNIWKEWADSNGNLGPIYGHQWRNFNGKPENIPQPKPNCALEPNVYGVGNSKGYSRSTATELDTKIYQTWKGMLQRCYDPKKDSYAYYGGKGVHVCDDWLVFENFKRDVQTLERWKYKITDWNSYHLDKDVIGDGFRYSPETCKWATRGENIRACHTMQYTVTDGKDEYTFRNTSDFIAEHGIAQGNFNAMLRGERQSAGGFSLVKAVDLSKGVDQLQWVVNEIKTNPNSRRLVVNSWNPGQLENMALPPCHCMFQFFVADGKLSCQLYQRSADMFLGVPFNIASYAILTMMVAQVTGLKLGEFVHTFGDAHIYLNHIDQVRLQLSRDHYDLPRLLLNPERSSIFGWDRSDFDLVSYEHHPFIKAQVAV